jgi:hypothetical protein
LFTIRVPDDHLLVPFERPRVIGPQGEPPVFSILLRDRQIAATEQFRTPAAGLIDEGVLVLNIRKFGVSPKPCARLALRAGLRFRCGGS